MSLFFPRGRQIGVWRLQFRSHVCSLQEAHIKAYKGYNQMNLVDTYQNNNYCVYDVKINKIIFLLFTRLFLKLCGLLLCSVKIFKKPQGTFLSLGNIYCHPTRQNQRLIKTWQQTDTPFYSEKEKSKTHHQEENCQGLARPKMEAGGGGAIFLMVS